MEKARHGELSCVLWHYDRHLVHVPGFEIEKEKDRLGRGARLEAEARSTGGARLEVTFAATLVMELWHMEAWGSGQ